MRDYINECEKIIADNEFTESEKLHRVKGLVYAMDYKLKTVNIGRVVVDMTNTGYMEDSILTIDTKSDTDNPDFKLSVYDTQDRLIFSEVFSFVELFLNALDKKQGGNYGK